MNQEEPMRYRFETRLGNWYERKVLEEIKMKDYLIRKEKKGLKCDDEDIMMITNYEPVDLVSRRDNKIRYGDQIMIQSQYNLSYIVSDTTYKVSSHFIEGYNVTGSDQVGSCRRSVLTIIPSRENIISREGDIIRYGDRVLIIVDSRLTNGRRLYLNSGPLTYNRQSSQSKQQEVLVVTKESPENVWQLEHEDPKQRFTSDGEQIDIRQNVLIKSSNTQNWLASSHHMVKNTFGKEREVYCHSHQSLSKSQNLISEKEGRTTIDQTLRNQNIQNSWRLIDLIDDMAIRQQYNQRYQQSQTDIAQILNMMKYNIITKKGLLGFRKLHLNLNEIGRETNGTIDTDNFKWVLIDNGIRLSNDEVVQVLGQLAMVNGVVNVDQVISVIRSSLNQYRHNLINHVYSQLQSRLNGSVTFKQIVSHYSPKRDPQVLNGSMTESEVFQQFTKQWETDDHNAIINQSDFLDFYHDVSVAMESDEHFEYMIRTAWEVYE